MKLHTMDEVKSLITDIENWVAIIRGIHHSGIDLLVGKKPHNSVDVKASINRQITDTTYAEMTTKLVELLEHDIMEAIQTLHRMGVDAEDVEALRQRIDARIEVPD